MRKKTVNHLADTVFWYIIYFLPVLCYLLYLFVEPGTSSGALVSFEAFCTSIGFGFAVDNIVLTSLSELFGANGILPLFASNVPFIIFTWFVSTFIAHLAVDFLLFIPRLAHKWFKTFTKGDD